MNSTLQHRMIKPSGSVKLKGKIHVRGLGCVKWNRLGYINYYGILHFCSLSVCGPANSFHRLQAIFMCHMTVFTIQSIFHNSPHPLASLCVTFAYFAGLAFTSRLFVIIIQHGNTFCNLQPVSLIQPTSG